jgi:hypothetical protein
VAGESVVGHGNGRRTAPPKENWRQQVLGRTNRRCDRREGGPIKEVRPGDGVWFPPDLRQWHGASPTPAMTHIAVQESQNGKNVDWLEKVSDKQYRK